MCPAWPYPPEDRIATLQCMDVLDKLQIELLTTWFLPTETTSPWPSPACCGGNRPILVRKTKVSVNPFRFRIPKGSILVAFLRSEHPTVLRSLGESSCPRVAQEGASARESLPAKTCLRGPHLIVTSSGQPNWPCGKTSLFLQNFVAAFAAALIAHVYAFFKVGVFPMPEFKVISPYEPSEKPRKTCFAGTPFDCHLLGPTELPRGKIFPQNSLTPYSRRR